MKIFIARKLGLAEFTVTYFKFSQLKSKDGIALYSCCAMLAKEHSLKFTNSVLSGKIFINKLQCIESSAQLYVAQRFYEDFLVYFNSVLTFEHLFEDVDSKLVLKLDKGLHAYLRSELGTQKIKLKKEIIDMQKLFRIFRFALRLILLLFKSHLSWSIDSKCEKNRILINLKNHEIFSNIWQHYRSQLFWLDVDATERVTLLIDKRSKNYISLQEYGDFIVTKKTRIRRLSLLQGVQQNFKTEIAKKFRIRQGLFFAIKFGDLVLNFMETVECYNKLVEAGHFEWHVYEEPSDLSTHAFNALASLGKIQTLQIQYSNLRMQSLLMLSNPTILLAFSKQYEKLFCYPLYSIGPDKVVPIGYRHPVSTLKMRKRAIALKSELNDRGVSFIIGYFDENTSQGRFSPYNNQDYLDNLHKLCEYVINFDNCAVVLKNQFISKLPNKLFPMDPLISAAIATGRFIFPSIGVHRNVIKPSEIGMICDITIGLAFGATASLESVLTGTPSILIDTENNLSEKYIVNYPNNLVFRDMNTALNAVSGLRENNNLYRELGNWDKFIGRVLIDKDLTSVSKIRQILDYKL